MDGEEFAIDCSSSDEEAPLNPRMPLCFPNSMQLSRKTECAMNKAESFNSSKKHQHNKAYSPSRPSDSEQESSAASKKRHSKYQELTEGRTPVSRIRSKKKLNLSNAEGFLPICINDITSKTINEIDTKDSGMIFPSNEATFIDEASSHITGAYVNVSEPQSPILGLRKTAAWSSPLIKTKKNKIKTSSSASGSCKIPKRKLDTSNIASVKRQLISEDETVQINTGTEANTKDQSNLNLDSKLNVCSGLNSNTKTGKLNESNEYDRESRVGQGRNQFQSSHSCFYPQPEAFQSEESLLNQAMDHCIKQAVPSKYEDQSDFTVSDKDLTDLSLTQGTPETCIDHQESQSIVVASEGTNSQVDYNIEMTLTPSKHSMEGTDVSEVSFPWFIT